jgi:hypothetical protein
MKTSQELYMELKARKAAGLKPNPAFYKTADANELANSELSYRLRGRAWWKRHYAIQKRNAILAKAKAERKAKREAIRTAKAELKAERDEMRMRAYTKQLMVQIELEIAKDLARPVKYWLIEE